MTCKFFSSCSSCSLFELSYEEQLEFKRKQILKDFDVLFDGDLEVCRSDTSAFRIRAEFKVGRETQSFQMMGFDKEFVDIDLCHIVDSKIFNLMPLVHKKLKENEIIRDKLFRLEFLASRSEILLTLIYHRKLDTLWEENAKAMSSDLGVHIIGRSRKQKVILSRDYIKETLNIADKTYHFYLQENTFIQPNRGINEKIISWLKNNIDTDNSKDLLELYCGHGNLTIPISSEFRNVLATEISKSSISNAKRNIEINNISNISFVKMSSEELSQAMNKEREFFRLKDIDLDSYDFSTILIDPPRAGLDEKTINLVAKFEYVLYISCSPISLKRDLMILLKTHNIKKMAIFDQFPYTKHIESGVTLRRKK